jgi:hypothetical protein
MERTDEVSYVTTIDPKLETISEAQYAIFKGCSDILEKPFSTNSANDSSFQFYTPPPNPNIIVNRRVKCRIPFAQATITATNLGATCLLQSGYFGLREAPVSSVLTTLESKFNSNQNVVQMSDIIHALLKYNTCSALIEGHLSTSTFYPDQSQNYSDLIGASSNPLGSYVDYIKGAQHQRGCWNMQIVTNTPTSATFTFSISENLFLSPYHYGINDNVAGFRGIQTIDTTFTFGNLSRMICYVNPDIENISNVNISVTFGAMPQPQLLFEYLTPRQEMMIPASVPAQYGMYRIDRYPTNGATAAPNANQIIVSNNIQLDQIPEILYIYCRENNNNLTPFDTDCFYQINSVNITLNGKNGILASATQEQLYDISVKNGLEMSYVEFSGGPVPLAVSTANPLGTLIGTVGSVICLRFGEDIPLNSGAPGMATNMMMQVNVGVTNINQTETTNPVLYLVTVKASVLEFLNTSSSLFQGFTPEIAANSDDYPMVSKADLMMVQGGADSFGKVKTFFKERVGPWLKENWPAILKGVVGIATKGLGEGEGGAEVGGRRRRRHKPVHHRRHRGGALLQY